MNIEKDLEELKDKGLLSQEQATAIQSYYEQKKPSQSKRLVLVFGVLGALLIGLGIILMLAHNWDNLTRLFKTILAFTPLVIAYIWVAFTLWKKNEEAAWRESSAVFLFFSLGACIALISQIYNLPGSLSAYLLTWMSLSLPIVYLLRSSVVGLLYLIGITYYACELSYFNYRTQDDFSFYFLLLFGLLPFYYSLAKEKVSSNALSFFSWLLPLSLTICLGTLEDSSEIVLFFSYMSLFAVFIQFSKFSFLQNRSIAHNGFLVVGILGTSFILFFGSFSWFWKDVHIVVKDFQSVEFIAGSALSILAFILFWFHKNKLIQAWDYVFILYGFLFFVSPHFLWVNIFINFLILALGIFSIVLGIQKKNIGTLNFGLSLIAILVACRFFDSDLSFIVRGIIFVLLGIGFFLANYVLLKRKSHE